MMKEDEANDKKQSQRVKVAVRIRPSDLQQIPTGYSNCLRISGENQITIGNDRNYTFDNVFGENSKQVQIYQSCVKNLVSSCFDGYNAAILAYGQTGSGKTYTMGTAASTLKSSESKGILPRVIQQLFEEVERREGKAQIIIKASYFQIYNDQIIDLTSEDITTEGSRTQNSQIQVREEKDGSMRILGVNEHQVQSQSQMLTLLKIGNLHRSTSATLMNDSSSRSHAILLIRIEQHVVNDLVSRDNAKRQDNLSSEILTAKFYFVDLAGSESLKKSGVNKNNWKETIKINSGLLQLGNVIAALAARERKNDQFVPYRNSILTRILQDSLGGNSNTYMIACLSPAMQNCEECLRTLNFASKAMSVQNKPVSNRKPQQATIIQGRQARVIHQINSSQYLAKFRQPRALSAARTKQVSVQSQAEILVARALKLNTNDSAHKILTQLQTILGKHVEFNKSYLLESRTTVGQEILSNGKFIIKFMNILLLPSWSSPAKVRTSAIKTYGESIKYHRKDFNEYLRFLLRIQDEKRFAEKQEEIRGSKSVKSKITSQFPLLCEWIENSMGKRIDKYQLLFRASQHDFGIAKFHRLCDNKPNTIVLVETQFGNIIGGFTPLPWKSENDEVYFDSRTILFSITMEQVMVNGIDKHSIICSKKCGPIFGYYDLAIKNTKIENFCTAQFPTSFNRANKYGEPYSRDYQVTQLFCGQKKSRLFKATQWQVFQVQFHDQQEK